MVKRRCCRMSCAWLYRSILLGWLLGAASSAQPGLPFRALPRESPPPVPALPAPVLPRPIWRALPNGLQLMVIERHDLPLVTLHLLVKSGAAAEPAGRAGTAQFVASMLDEGTAHHNAEEIAELIDGVGGRVDSGSGWDDSSLVVSVLTPSTDLAFHLVADMAMHPTFPSGQVERLRTRTLSALNVLGGDPSYVADTVFDRLVFAGTPYDHPADGTPDSVRRITVNDLQEFYRRCYRPDNAVLAVAGDIRSADALRDAARYFGSWRSHRAAAFHRRQAPGIDTPRLVVIDKPDAVQTEIRIGNRAPSRSSPEYEALSIANQILGGPASNRLFSTLRSQQGLTYGASSELVCYRDSGSWEAKTSTRTSETMRTVRLILEQMRRLRDHPVSDEEIRTAQNYLIGHQALDFETTDGAAQKWLSLLVDGLALDYWHDFPDRLRAQSSRQLWEATRRYLDPDHAVMVLVGDAARFSKELKAFGPLQIIPLSRLDLNSPSLEK